MRRRDFVAVLGGAAVSWPLSARAQQTDRRPVVASINGRTQANHADIAQHVTGVNRAFESPAVTQFWNPLTAAGRAALDAMITQQAQIIAYIDDYKLLMIATLAVIPLLLVFKKTSDRGSAGPIPIGE